MTTRGAFSCKCSTISDLRTEFTLSNGKSVAMCQLFSDATAKLDFQSKIQGYTIVILNVILKQICFRIVEWIGYKKMSDKYSKATRMTFVAVLVNSCILPILVTANF